MCCTRAICLRFVIYAAWAHGLLCSPLIAPPSTHCKVFSPLLPLLSPPCQVYRLYSESITAAITSGGPHAARSSFVKYMRSVKKAVLRLVEVFVDKCDDGPLLATKFVPALMEPVLGDYGASVPDAR